MFSQKKKEKIRTGRMLSINVLQKLLNLSGFKKPKNILKTLKILITQLKKLKQHLKCLFLMLFLLPVVTLPNSPKKCLNSPTKYLIIPQ